MPVPINGPIMRSQAKALTVGAAKLSKVKIYKEVLLLEQHKCLYEHSMWREKYEISMKFCD